MNAPDLTDGAFVPWKVIFFSFLQPLNAFLLIFFTPLPIFTSVNLEHPLNAFLPISTMVQVTPLISTFSLISTFFKFLFPDDITTAVFLSALDTLYVIFVFGSVVCEVSSNFGASSVHFAYNVRSFVTGEDQL